HVEPVLQPHLPHEPPEHTLRQRRPTDVAETDEQNPDSPATLPRFTQLRLRLSIQPVRELKSRPSRRLPAVLFATGSRVHTVVRRPGAGFYPPAAAGSTRGPPGHGCCNSLYTKPLGPEPGGPMAQTDPRRGDLYQPWRPG